MQAFKRGRRLRSPALIAARLEALRFLTGGITKGEAIPIDLKAYRRFSCAPESPANPAPGQRRVGRSSRRRLAGFQPRRRVIVAGVDNAV